jgi:hypothetical protein
LSKYIRVDKTYNMEPNGNLKEGVVIISEEVHHERDMCGIIMPISGKDEYSKEHWEEVYNILKEVIDSAGFDANLVSFTKDTSIIHANIVTNLADNPIVVCDVSSKNPNVMFELGLRLALDKAVVVIKDEKTDYSFDTSPIEHLSYPADLNYHAIKRFKEQLKEKIEATRAKSLAKDYSPFLKHFVKLKAKKLDEREAEMNEIVLQKINNLEKIILSNNNYSNSSLGTSNNNDIEFKKEFEEKMKVLLEAFLKKNKHIVVQGNVFIDEFLIFLLKALPGYSRVDIVTYLKENRTSILDARTKSMATLG